jgi:hypothetical protein
MSKNPEAERHYGQTSDANHKKIKLESQNLEIKSFPFRHYQGKRS